MSGGADSTALALLADAWARDRGRQLLAMVVDHGLRPESAAEAAMTVSRLEGRGIAARLLTITDLSKGPALASRARDARYRVLRDACAEAGIIHLLLGHHAADQAETMMIRALSGSGGRGLAGMPAATETATLRLLRPLLTVAPVYLRAYLQERGMAWIEDPSNRDPSALRARLRQVRSDPSGEGPGSLRLLRAARHVGVHRKGLDSAIARRLAASVAIRPEGFALLSKGTIEPEALAELLRTIAGAAFAPGLDRIATLAGEPGPKTVWGVRIQPAGRLGEGWLLTREDAAVADPVPARNGAVWDGRFRLSLANELPAGTLWGALGNAAAGLRGQTDLPAAVLRTMPALWRRNILEAVPHLLYRSPTSRHWCCGVVFDPPRPMCPAPFLPAE